MLVVFQNKSKKKTKGVGYPMRPQKGLHHVPVVWHAGVEAHLLGKRGQESSPPLYILPVIILHFG